MRNGVTIGIATVALLLTTTIQSAQPEPSPLEVVNRRMQYYNDHRVDAMLELYGDDIAVYTYPDKLLGKGKVHLRRTFEEILADKSVRVTITQQLSKDSYVINNETVSYAGKPTQYVSIYEVRGGLIRSVRFVRD
jgi:hypothetical protein